MDDIILRTHDICKKYPGVKVLDNISLDIKRGEIHGLCGENGAGKSTLIKILTGATEPTSGEIEFDGKKYDRLTPKQSMNLGINVIYQEFSLIPYLTVAENIFYGREIKKGILRDKNAIEKRAKELCEEFGVHLDIKKRVCDLGVASQQIVEILKAVSQKSKLIIMDEPTAPLTIKETDIFVGIVRKLQKEKVTIIFISHRLEEVFEICDRVTVLTDGKQIATKDVKEIDKQQLISYMVGREIRDDYPKPNREIGDTILEMNDVCNENVKDVNLKLRKGEILGIAGLVGAGRTELARILFGADPLQMGKIQLFGKNYKPRSPREALNKGIGLIPEDRKAQGLVLPMSVGENIVYSSLVKLSKYLVINNKKEIEDSDKHINELRIKTPSRNQLVKNLSGGNQQKVVLGRIIETECKILIFDEPTRGIDIGAKQEIYNLMCRIVEQGQSIIMISSEMPELIGMADRILVMSGGKITGELGKNEFKQEKILELASMN